MSGTHLTTLRGRQLREMAYEAIKSAILDLELKPGEQLVETALARKLGTSTVPVREALLRLDRDGFVKLVPFKGAYVTPVTEDDLREIFELRQLLEGRLAAHAALTLSDAKLAELDAINASVDAAITRGDYDLCHRAFGRWDDVLIDNAASGRLRAAMVNLKEQLLRIGAVSCRIPGRVETSHREHRAITEAIRARAPARAETRMRAHLGSLLDAILNSGDEYLRLLSGRPAEAGATDGRTGR